jgi:hypothetical protein
MRWIVFDDDTADFVTGKCKRGAAEVRYDELPLDAVLKSQGGSVLLLPAAEPGRVLLARIERSTSEATTQPRSSVVAQFTPVRTIAAQKFPPAESNSTRPAGK